MPPVQQQMQVTQLPVVATTGAAVAQGAAINATEVVANGAAQATANVASAVATGAANVAQGAEAVKNDAANSKTDIQTTVPENKILNLVFSLKSPEMILGLFIVSYFDIMSFISKLFFEFKL